MIDTMTHGPVREVQMNRPPANALSPDLVRALDKALAEAIDSGAGAVVLSGLPGMFSAGLDVPTLLMLDRDGVRSAWSDFLGLLRSIAESPVPTAAAITGHSPAGGAVISLFCDYRVMAEGEFKIGLNEVEVGIILPLFMFRALERLVGPRQAERLATAAMMVSSDEALDIGMVDEVVPMEEVVPRCLARCERLVSLPPRAMAETRANARRGLIELFDRVDDRFMDELVDLWFSDETHAALTALVERLRAR